MSQPTHSSNGNSPALSVIIAVGGQRARAGRALQSLLDQSIIDRMEILLFDLGPKECSPLPGSDHPRVKLTRWDPTGLLSTARAQGIRAAKSPVVAFMEEHCEMQAGWAEAVVSDHKEPWAGVGTDFINANPDAGKSNKAFQMNYGSYIRPVGGRGPTRLIAGQNSSFKRNVLLRYEPNLVLLLKAEMILQWKILEDGYQMFYDPSVKIAHLNENTFRRLAIGVFYWNWGYGNVRAQVYKWGPFRRWTWIVLSPLIPWLRLLRLFRQQLTIRPVPFSQFLRDIPFIFGISLCSAAGQVVGLLKSGERAYWEFSHFEMNEPRLSREEFAR